MEKYIYRNLSIKISMKKLKHQQKMNKLKANNNKSKLKIQKYQKLIQNCIITIFLIETR